jgi:hypothetical protein
MGRGSAPYECGLALTLRRTGIARLEIFEVLGASPVASMARHHAAQWRQPLRGRASDAPIAPA